MRAVFVILLAVNLAVAGWYGFGSAERTAPTLIPPREDGERLVLLGEMNSAALRQTVIKPVAAGDKGDAKCLLLGPFKTENTSDIAKDRLAAWDVPAKLSEIEVKDGLAHWVHLQPEISRKAALRKLRELQSKKIDSFVIPDGELENGISFGVFVNLALAEALQGKIEALGYPAKIQDIKRTRMERWLVIETQFAQYVDDSMWGKLQDIEKGLDRRQGYCPGVASK